MKLATQQFLNDFHSLNGETIGERRRNLFHLINNTDQSVYSEINFSALQPKTHLEALFKVELMIHLQKSGDLLEILKSENSILIRKVLKAKSWFWQDGFKNTTGRQFVDNILGHVSFNVKIQVLNKLAIYLEDSEKGNEYYECVRTKYGLYLAGKLIPCCTKDFILLKIKRDNIKLASAKLLLIVKKYPDAIEDILLALNNIGVNLSDWSYRYSVFKFIANTNIELYLKLQQKYGVAVHLGRRCTKRYVNVNVQEVVNNAQKYYKCFHSRKLVRSLKTNFDYFYVNIFPKTKDSFSYYDCRDVLEVLKHLRHPDINIIPKTFKYLYGQELSDNPDLVSLDFLKMLSSDEREVYISQDYKPYSLSDYEWMTYRPIRVAIPYLKDRIAFHSNIRSRAELVGLLVKTCKINKDKATLTQICQFMVDHHRNDHVAVRNSFLQNIHRLFELEDLNDSHWIPINQLIKIFTLNNESFYDKETFLEKYILYCLKLNLPFKEEYIELCKLKNSINYNFFKQFPNFEKICLLEFANIIPDLQKEQTFRNFSGEYISALIDYNEKHPQNKISIFTYPNAMNAVKKDIDTSIIMPYCARIKDNANECIHLVHYFLATKKQINFKTLIYLLHRHIKIVQKHIKKITNLVLQETGSKAIKFWNLCKNYEHLGIPQTIVKICLNKIGEDSEDSHDIYKNESIMHALSCLLPPHEYLQIITLHYPSGLKAEAETLTDQKMFDLQKCIGASLRYLSPSSEALDSILIFCKGDYLKLVWSTLYSVCSKTNEDKLQPFIAELINRAVSVRKHALHLTFDMMDINEINNIMDKFMNNEKNASIRKYIFKHAFNFFVKNRNDYSWELVKTTITAVELNDHESFGILVQPRIIPKDYLIKYLKFTWEFLEGLPDPNNKIEDKKNTIIQSMQNEIVALSKELSEPRSIIEKYFFKLADSNKVTSFQSAIQVFACKYVIYGEPAYMPQLFNALKNYINFSWHNEETEANGRENIQNFIQTFCNQFLYSNNSLLHIEILNNFIDLWNTFLKPEEAFVQYLHLQLTAICLNNETVSDMVTELVTFCNNLVAAYGVTIVNTFSRKINIFAYHLVKFCQQKSIYELIANLVENHSSIPALLLAIELINSNNAANDKTKEMYKTILQILKAKNEPVIKVLLNLHICK